MANEKIKELLDGKDIRLFSDFADGEDWGGLLGKSAKLGDVLDKEIIITAYKISPSIKNPGKNYLTLQFVLDEELFVLFTGSGVLMKLIEKYGDKLPFRTIVKKNHKYFVFS